MDTLHGFNIIDASERECGDGKETVDHFLLNSELYDEERESEKEGWGARDENLHATKGLTLTAVNHHVKGPRTPQSGA
jgi:hypothetical protein